MDMIFPWIDDRMDGLIRRAAADLAWRASSTDEELSNKSHDYVYTTRDLHHLTQPVVLPVKR